MDGLALARSNRCCSASNASRETRACDGRLIDGHDGTSRVRHCHALSRSLPHSHGSETHGCEVGRKHARIRCFRRGFRARVGRAAGESGDCDHDCQQHHKSTRSGETRPSISRVRVNSFWPGWCMWFHDAYSLESIWHVALLVRGSNKVQQDSPVHLGKTGPGLAEGQVLLIPSLQPVSEETQFAARAHRNARDRYRGWFLRRTDETLTHARLLHEYEGFPF